VLPIWIAIVSAVLLAFRNEIGSQIEVPVV
jgi:hypothetical protein